MGEGESARRPASAGNQADNSATNAGAVYVFTSSGSTWSQQANIKEPIRAPGTASAQASASADPGSTLAVAHATNESSLATGMRQPDRQRRWCRRRAVLCSRSAVRPGVSRRNSRRSIRTPWTEFGARRRACRPERADPGGRVSHRISTATGIGGQPGRQLRFQGRTVDGSRAAARRGVSGVHKESRYGRRDFFGARVGVGRQLTLVVGAEGGVQTQRPHRRHQADNPIAHREVYVLTRSGAT